MQTPHSSARSDDAYFPVPEAAKMRVLIIEDSSRLRESLSTGLRCSGFSVDAVGDAESALPFLRTASYPVVVLDLGLPGMDGVALLTLMRREKLCESVLVLSARDHVQDRIESLNSGADDYLVKPFDFDELLARINALVRRIHDQRDPVISLGDVQIDTARKRVTAKGAIVPLVGREYQTLELLARYRGKLLSRSQIFEALSSADRDASDRVIEVVVSLVRRKLAAAGITELIRFERGLGYVID
jgi:two-component system, OmpR family, response regulator QseB